MKFFFWKKLFDFWHRKLTFGTFWDPGATSIYKIQQFWKLIFEQKSCFLGSIKRETPWRNWHQLSPSSTKMTNLMNSINSDLSMTILFAENFKRTLFGLMLLELERLWPLRKPECYWLWGLTYWPKAIRAFVCGPSNNSSMHLMVKITSIYLYSLVTGFAN